MNMKNTNFKNNNNDTKKKKKKVVYGTYDEKRNEPEYIKKHDYKMGLNDHEVEERIENLQVNIEGKIESNFKKNFRMILKVFAKNTFTFFNILYILVLILLLVASHWNKQPGIDSGQTFAITDFVFLGIVTFNLVVGIIQESRSKLAINKLKLLTNPKVTLIRNGEKVEKSNTDIVLDDIVYLTPGIQIVSDAELIEDEIEVNESQLTGESIPIKKKKGDIIYSGSFVVSGTSYAKVIHVGKLNEINKLTSQAKKYVAPNSQILLGLRKLLLVIGFFIVLTSIAMFVWSWDWNGYKALVEDGKIMHLTPALKENYIRAIKPITAAIIGMIPAGLYLLTSVALSVGVFRLSKSNTLVQDIYCIEMLARVNVLCLDKTGTITNGQMSVINYDLINKGSKHKVEDIISSMNAALQETNATAKALESYFGIKAVLKPTEVIPFSSERKFSAVTFGSDTYITGAPDFVLKGNFDKYSDLITEYANKGLRVLCLAHSNLPIKDGKIQRIPQLVALILIEDQIREEAPATIAYFKENGVEVKVISGDNPITVSEVARRVGIEGAEKCISLQGMTDEQVIEAATKFTVFGRVKPEQKKLLVEALKSAGKTVAMTGDGVNDIPALKSADCSIAMASGNDAVKGVAQLVLVDSNFASMPKVVAEGRRVINNVQQTAMLYLVKTLFMTCLAVLTASGFFYLISQKNSDLPLYQNFLNNATFPFAGSKQLMILEMFAIGLPSIVLALQYNNAPIKGNFMKNALKRALPGAVGVVCAIIFTFLFSRQYGFTVAEVKTVVSLTATFTLLIVMCRACIPYNKKKIILCFVMCLVSVALIILSMNNISFNMFGKTIDFYRLFEYCKLDWKVLRPIDGTLEEVRNATAAWLTFGMVVVSFTLMLGVELLFKNIELNKEITKNKQKEEEKKKTITIRRIRY